MASDEFNTLSTGLYGCFLIKLGHRPRGIAPHARFKFTP